MYDVTTRKIADGKATGVSVKWSDGQFCFIATERGILGCGIFDINVFNEVGYVGAFAKGTKEKPFVEPEDLLDGRVSLVSEKAREIGIIEDMTGEEVLQKLLRE